MNQNMFTSLSLLDLEFFAEETIITIVPNFTEASINLITGKFGPFKAQKPTDVPLWLALYLRTRSKCSLTVPMCYNVEYLNKKLEDEKEYKNYLTPLPDNFFEIFHLLFQKAKEDFEDAMQSKSLLEDIKQVRLSKLTKIVKDLNKQDSYVIFDNITDYELNIFRPLAGEAFNKLNELKKIGAN